MIRIALCLLLALVAEAALAYPATYGYPSYTNSNTATSDTSPGAACALSNPTTYGPVVGSYTYTPGVNTTLATFAPTQGFWDSTFSRCVRGPNGSGLYASIQINGTGTPAYSCPNGGTLSGTTCTCPSGYTDSGTACIAPTCPAVGASTGTHNVTTGWGLSPIENASDIVDAVPAGLIYGAAHCVDTGSSGLCSMEVDLSATDPVQECYRSQTASSQGLYRVSCDFKMKSRSTSACTASTTQPSNPSSAPADCPSGTIGTVNGKAVCLGTMPASGVNFGKPQDPGNPRAGTSPTETNAAREPSSGSGGGADARGGPGVTVGRGGGVGTGSDKTTGGSGGGGTGQGIEIPTDYAREPTTADIKANTGALKSDHDGANAAAEGQIANLAEHHTKMGTEYYNKDTMGLPSTETSPYTPVNVDALKNSIPGSSGSCVTYPMNMGFGGTVNINPCPLLDVVHPVINWGFLMLCILTAVFMVFRPQSAGEAA